MSAREKSDIRRLWMWALALIVTVAGVTAIALISHTFAYEVNVASAPVLEYTALQCVAGFAWLALVALTIRSSSCATSVRLSCVIVAGVLLRILMFDTHPILETDHYRYLWDGAVTAAGQNPYAHPPALIQGADDLIPPVLLELGQSSTPVLDRVNQPALTTPYPLIAQGAYALAAKINAFDLNAWRWVLFSTEILTLVLLLVALKEFGAPALYCTIYWLNPLVIKEVANTTHVDGLLSPLLLVIAIAIARRWQWATLAAIAIAAGIKIWPLMLTPFARGEKPAIIRAVLFSVIVLVVLLLPMSLSTNNPDSGLYAYASEWRMNSAGFSIIHFVAELIVGRDNASVVSRLLVASIVVCVLGFFTFGSNIDAGRTLDRVILAIATLLLLAPAVYPWYFLWLAVLLALRPRLSLLLLTAALPLYYSRFFFAATDQNSWFNNIVLWIEFGPVFMLMAFELIKSRSNFQTR